MSSVQYIADVGYYCTKRFNESQDPRILISVEDRVHAHAGNRNGH